MISSAYQKRILPSVFVVVLAFAAVGHAAEWVEPPFDPVVGSRWIVSSDETSEENRAGRTQIVTGKTLSELSFDEKTTDGYRVTYVLRSAESSGALAEAVGSFSKALENIVVHAVLDRSGMPLRIENTDEVQAAVHSGIERILERFSDKPEIAAALRPVMEGRLNARDRRGAGRILAALPLLALGQNTGLRPGETKYGSEEFAGPFGGEMLKAATELHIESAEPASGNVRLIYTLKPDKDSMLDFTKRVMKQLAGAVGLPQQDSAKLKQLDITFESRTELEVENGMTRTVNRVETTAIALQGQRLVKRARNDVRVTKAP